MSLLVAVGLLIYLIIQRSYRHCRHVCLCDSKKCKDLSAPIAYTLVVQTYNNGPYPLQQVCDYVISSSENTHIVLLEKGTHVDSTSVHCARMTRHHLLNTGRDLGSFLWYVVHFYDRLEGVYIFTSGNLQKHKRNRRLRYLLNDGHKCFSSMNKTRTKRLKQHENWRIGSWLGRALVPACPRGFRNWFEAHIGPWKQAMNKPVCLNGLFRTNATNLRRRPKVFYEALLLQTSVHCDTEVVHYIERAVCAIFGP